MGICESLEMNIFGGWELLVNGLEKVCLPTQKKPQFGRRSKKKWANTVKRGKQEV